MEGLKIAFSIIAGALLTAAISGGQIWAYGTALTCSLIVLVMPDD